MCSDSQSRQGFVLLEQQLWNLAETVLVETPGWTQGHGLSRLDRGQGRGAALGVLQPLQLLQLVKRSSLHSADLVLHQVSEERGTSGSIGLVCSA